MSGRASTAALVAHQLRARTGAVSVVAAFVAILALLATLTPLALGIVADAALRERLADLAATERDVVATAVGMPQLGGAAEDSWPDFLGDLDAIRTEAAEPVPEVLGAPQAITRTAARPEFGTQRLSVAFAPDYARHIRIVAGAEPAPATGLRVSDRDPSDVLRIEIVLSTDSLAELGMAVGDTWVQESTSRERLEFVIAGAFEPVDPAGDFWQHAPSILAPQIDDDGNRPRVVIATGFAAPDSLGYALLVSAATSTDAWFPVDAAAITSVAAARTAAGLRELTAVSHTVSTQSEGGGILGLRFDADITAQIETALAQQTSTSALLAMLVAGPAGVAAAVLVLGCRLILESRRPALRLLSARGASLGQLRGLLGIEALVVGLVPAVIGAVLGVLLGALWAGAVPTPAILVPALLPALLLGVAPLVILVVLAPSAAERQPRADLGRRASRLRLAAEGAVLVLAVIAVLLLFLRGYSDGVDVLVAATPLLIALAACLVTLRLYPLPLRAIWRRARARAGLDAFLGASRALREPSIGLTPVLALTVGVCVAVSAGVMLSVLQHGTDEAARSQVGADIRVTGGSFSADVVAEVSALDGVAAVTGISGLVPATLDVDGSRRATSVFIVDGAALRDVQGDGPGMLPDDTTLPTGADPVSLVVSDALARMIDGEADLRLDGTDAAVVGVTRGPVPIGLRENWAAIDASAAVDVLGRDPSDRVLLLRVDDGADPRAVGAELRTVLGDSVRIDTAGEVGARLSGGPAAQGVRTALLASTAVAALLGALALAMTLTLGATSRARTVALLRTLGAPRRSGTSLAMWEAAPPAIAAVITGTAFGVLLPLVMLAAVDLRPFTGSQLAPVYRLDPAVIAVTLGGFLLLSAASTALALFVSRRVRAAGALRTVEEG